MGLLKLSLHCKLCVETGFEKINWKLILGLRQVHLEYVDNVLSENINMSDLSLQSREQLRNALLALHVFKNSRPKALAKAIKNCINKNPTSAELYLLFFYIL